MINTPFGFVLLAEGERFAAHVLDGARQAECYHLLLRRADAAPHAERARPRRTPLAPLLRRVSFLCQSSTRKLFITSEAEAKRAEAEARRET